MTTIIEKNSRSLFTLFMTISIIFLIAGGVWIAYESGALGERTSVIENNDTMALPVQHPIHAHPIDAQTLAQTYAY